MGRERPGAPSHGRSVVAFYNEVRPHSALRGRTPASITLPSCSPASRPLRAGFAGGLRPGLTQAARDGADEGGRDGETPLDRTKKHRHDGRDGNPETLLLNGGNWGSGQGGRSCGLYPQSTPAVAAFGLIQI